MANLEQMAKRQSELGKMSKNDIVAIGDRHYRVADWKDCDKWTAIAFVMQAEFGRKACKEYDESRKRR